jgi:hypothetical protein
VVKPYIDLVSFTSGILFIRYELISEFNNNGNNNVSGLFNNLLHILMITSLGLNVDEFIYELISSYNVFIKGISKLLVGVLNVVTLLVSASKCSIFLLKYEYGIYPLYPSCDVFVIGLFKINEKL